VDILVNNKILKFKKMNHLSYELQYLRETFIEMIELVKSQFTKSITALLNNDTDLSEEILRAELRVNAFEINIEKECENIIALFQPVATDLRYVLAIMRSVSELERIGDHAEFAAKIVLDRHEPFEKEMISKYSVVEMYELIVDMYDNITEAFVSKNSETARKIFKKDKVVNKLYKQSVKLMKEELPSQNPRIADILNIYAINSRLERSGDLITNIAEEIIFYIDAEILKHNKKSKKNIIEV